MDAKVTLALSVILSLTNPPSDVQTVAQYRDYIQDQLTGSASAERARPGRPLKIQHPKYTDSELKAVLKYLTDEIRLYPDNYTVDGRVARGLADTQPNDETIFYLDNGLSVHFSTRIPFEEGKALPMFPPSVGG